MLAQSLAESGAGGDTQFGENAVWVIVDGAHRKAELGGGTFTIVPGDVLLAEDLTGTGHEWHMVGDDPWRRAYVIFPPGVDTQFVPAVT
jgi:hypothetical protein